MSSKEGNNKNDSRHPKIRFLKQKQSLAIKQIRQHQTDDAPFYVCCEKTSQIEVQCLRYIWSSKPHGASGDCGDIVFGETNPTGDRIRALRVGKYPIHASLEYGNIDICKYQ